MVDEHIFLSDAEVFNEKTTAYQMARYTQTTLSLLGARLATAGFKFVDHSVVYVPHVHSIIVTVTGVKNVNPNADVRGYQDKAVNTSSRFPNAEV